MRVAYDQLTLAPRPLGKGGEGVVTQVLAPAHLASLCLKERTSSSGPATWAKLKHQIEHPPKVIETTRFRLAWPKYLVTRGTQNIGFLMPAAFSQSCSLLDLTRQKVDSDIGPEFRKFDLERKEGLLNRAKICLNVCAGLKVLYSGGDYNIIDLKPENILVTPKGNITIVDLDSIQVRDGGQIKFEAWGGTDGYRPPEGCVENPPETVKDIYWDVFSLAVILYQVLVGAPPFSGNFSPPYDKCYELSDKIKAGLFVFGPKQKFIRNRHSIHDTYTALPSEMRTLFERALGGGRRETRPLVEEWGAALSAMIAGIEGGLLRMPRVAVHRPKSASRASPSAPGRRPSPSYGRSSPPPPPPPPPPPQSHRPPPKPSRAPWIVAGSVLSVIVLATLLNTNKSTSAPAAPVAAPAAAPSALLVLTGATLNDGAGATSPLAVGAAAASAVNATGVATLVVGYSGATAGSDTVAISMEGPMQGRCNPVVLSDAAGSVSCGFSNLADGDYAFQVDVNGSRVATYNFNVANTARFNQIITGARIADDVSGPFESLPQTPTLSGPPTSVGIAVNYQNARTGDYIDAALYSAGNQLGACRTWTTQSPWGVYRCQFPVINVQQGEFQVSINGHLVGQYPFSVSAPQDSSSSSYWGSQSGSSPEAAPPAAPTSYDNPPPRQVVKCVLPSGAQYFLTYDDCRAQSGVVYTDH